MKTKGLFLAVCIISLFSGCAKLKEVTLDKTVTMNFEVDLQADDPLELDLLEVLEVATGNLEEYKDAIKSYKIRDVRYKIWEFWTHETADDVILNGDLKIGSLTGNAPGVFYNLTDYSLLAASEDPSHTKFNFSGSDVKKIEQYLLGTNGLKIWLNGSVSSVPVHFKLQVVVDLSVTAEKK